MEKNSLKEKLKILLIGGSAGSLDVVLQILAELSGTLPFAILIVLHRKNDAESLLVNLLASRTKLPVKEVDDKDPMQPGWIYIAPPDYHVLLESDGSFSLDASEKVNYSRPSIDVSFESAADAHGAACGGIVLSGANADGTAGLQAIHQCGGWTAVQEPSTAEVAFMPKAAMTDVDVDEVLGKDEIASRILKFA